VECQKLPTTEISENFWMSTMVAQIVTPLYIITNKLNYLSAGYMPCQRPLMKTF